VVCVLSKNLARTVLHNPPYSTDLAASDLEPSERPSEGKSFGNDEELIEELAAKKIQTGKSRGYMLPFLAGARLGTLMEII
jgi:hypothetical protein